MDQPTVLWGTLSPKLRSDPEALRDYFVGAFKVLSGLKVAFGDHLIRVHGNTAVNTGYYTLRTCRMGKVRLSGSLQLHLCKERRPLDDRRPSFFGNAGVEVIDAANRPGLAEVPVAMVKRRKHACTH